MLKPFGQHRQDQRADHRFEGAAGAAEQWASTIGTESSSMVSS
jgi:hypothetical protein